MLDFGIAKAAERGRARAARRKSRIKGKLAYLSPEQVRDAELDGRSDVFSLGVVLWEMLAGQRLFAGENEFQTLRNVLTQPVPPPSSKRPEVPAALDAVVARALERERAARPDGAAPSPTRSRPAVPEVADAATARQGVAALLDELFGDGAAAERRERMTSSFTARERFVAEQRAVPSACGRRGLGGARLGASAGNADGASRPRAPRQTVGRAGRVAVIVAARRRRRRRSRSPPGGA